MPAQWVALLFGEMRVKKIKDKDLAAEVGWHPKYLSRVLNGHTNPKGAEEKLRAALDRLTADKSDDK